MERDLLIGIDAGTSVMKAVVFTTTGEQVAMSNGRLGLSDGGQVNLTGSGDIVLLFPEDAHASARHVEPELSEHDLSHLGAYQVAARLVVAGEETPAFTLRTRPPSSERDGRSAEVRKAARTAYGRPVERARRLVVATPPEAMAFGGDER